MLYLRSWHGAARAALPLSLLFAALASCGCGQTEVPKTEDPAAVEKMRQEYQDMSKRERGG